MDIKGFSEIKGRFGFGLMRLPMLENGEVDIKQVSKMVDHFISRGFNYFDTAHGYIDGKSERAIKEAISSRYSRESFILTNKLSSAYFNKREDIRKVFHEQLEATGVSYFDIYLMHALSRGNYEQYERCEAFKEALDLKEEGLIRHLGISFHDDAEFLDKILTEHPEIEIVQLQFNYLDYEDPVVQSRKCYEVCVKHDKPIIVMEPVKGGTLAKVPDEAKALLSSLSASSPASYALRYVLGFPQIRMVISGMSDIPQMDDNLETASPFVPLNTKEKEALDEVVRIFMKLKMIPCTNCQYCLSVCPMKIKIPFLFSALNLAETRRREEGEQAYGEALKDGSNRASVCLKCGLCEKECPQHIEIRKHLERVRDSFER